MRRASVKADERNMTISAYTRLEQMRSEIESTHKISPQTKALSETAVKDADRILDEDEAENNAVIDRVNDLIEQATTRPH
jgi:hypothetical protein